METRRLKAFVRIVDAGSLTRAANQLGIAQPALSQQVLALEAEFGAQLLVRGRHGVSPTEAGLVLYRHAQAILNQMNQARGEVRNASGEISGEVNIGMPLSAAAIVTVPLVQIVTSRHPLIKLNFTDGLPPDLMTEFTINGRLDMCFRPTGSSQKGITCRPLLFESLGAVASPEGRSNQQKGPIPLCELVDQPLVLSSRGTHMRQVIEAAFASLGATPRVVAEMNSVFSLCAAAAAKLGTAIVPIVSVIRSNPERLIGRTIVEPEITRPLYLCVADTSPPTAASTAVCAIIYRLVAELVSSGTWIGARLADTLEPIDEQDAGSGATP